MMVSKNSSRLRVRATASSSRGIRYRAPRTTTASTPRILSSIRPMASRGLPVACPLSRGTSSIMGTTTRS